MKLAGDLFKLQRIQGSKMKKSLKMMKTGKALGPDDIPIEVWSLSRICSNSVAH
jgi:hypothetical protein